MEPVVVTAAPVQPTERQAPTAFATEIDPAPYAAAVTTVTDALAESVGVSVRRYGGLGAFSTVSIRGSSANQVQIYLDGVPLSRARNETVNLSDLPLDSLERIEVYRGTVPVNFGAAGLGGVVNLVTKTPSATPESQASASYGSFDTRKVVVARTQQVQGIDLLGYVTYLGSAGNFGFLGQNPAAGAPVGQQISMTRINNAFDSVDAVLKGGAALGSNLRLDLTSETFFKNQGVPGAADPNQSTNASSSDLRALNYLRLTSADALAPGLDASATLYGIYEGLHFSDPDGDLGEGSQDRHDHTGVVGGNVSGTYFLAAHQALGWFTELSHETFNPSNDVPQAPNEPEERRLQTTLALQHQAGFLEDRVLIVPSVRYQYVQDTITGSLEGPGRPTIPAQTRSENPWGSAVGAQVRLTPWLAARGNIGRFERTPNFEELFGTNGSFVGNPTLQPEVATNRDIGFVADTGPYGWLDHAHLEYAYFNNDIQDLIVLVQAHPSFATLTNTNARVSGHEVASQLSAANHLRLDTNYTHQEGTNLSHVFNGAYFGNQLPGRPEDELYTRVEIFGPVGKVYYEFNYLSGNFRDQVNFQQVPSRTIHTVGGAWNATAALTVGLEVRNLTSNQISDVSGFPLPGRAFFGTVTVKF